MPDTEHETLLKALDDLKWSLIAAIGSVTLAILFLTLIIQVHR